MRLVEINEIVNAYPDASNNLIDCCDDLSVSTPKMGWIGVGVQANIGQMMRN